eukprot:1046412-Ditylum_brightwellii.AAC.1
MTKVGITFGILENDKHTPIGWVKITGHLIFDVKIYFTRKTRWVLDGHKTPDPVGSTYADIKNAYLQAPSSQKHCIVCGAEFGLENMDKRALIQRALYGGKSAGKDFWNHLRERMRHLKFVSCPVDPDVLMWSAIHSDGSTHYEYILLYTDDALAIWEYLEKLLCQRISKYFQLKEESVGHPKFYLSGSVCKNVEEYLAKRNNPRWNISAKAETPIRSTYKPELEITSVLYPVDGAYYHSLVGVLRWMVELGKIDIYLEVSLMSSHLAMPREGHMAEVLRIFIHLRKYHNTELVFGPSNPVMDELAFEQKDWTSSEFGHAQGKEEVPRNKPESRGMGFVMRAKVDADHAGDTITR